MKIRKINNEDLRKRVDMMNHPKVYSSMYYTIPITIENTEKWYYQNLDNESRIDFVFDQNDELCAMGGVTNIDYTSKRAELYLFVNPENQNKGVGTKATNLICKYAFYELNLKEVYLFIKADNIAAIKAYEKNNFKIQNTKSENKYSNETLLYTLTKNEYNKNI